MDNVTILNEKKNRCVRSAAVSRWLLRRGHTIIDIKPDKYVPERSVCVFGADDTLNADIDASKEELIAVRNSGEYTPIAVNLVPTGEKTVYVSHASIARHLIRIGHVVRDIRPNKENREKTDFVFLCDDTLIADINEGIKAEQEKRKYYGYTKSYKAVV